jgi:hypothetical protein
VQAVSEISDTVFGKYGKWKGIKFAEKNPYSETDSFLRGITTGST